MLSMKGLNGPHFYNAHSCPFAHLTQWPSFFGGHQAETQRRNTENTGVMVESSGPRLK